MFGHDRGPSSAFNWLGKLHMTSRLSYFSKAGRE